MLVTGAGGMLGGALVRAAMHLRVEGTWRTKRPALAIPLHHVDLGDAVAVERLFREVRPGSVIHCAARTSVDACEADPEGARRDNVDASRLLARAAHGIGASFIYVSTDAVYAGDQGMHRETDAVGPRSVYAQTKLSGEDAACAEHPRCLVVRTNLYGTHAGLAAWALGRLRAGESLRGFQDVRFNPLYVEQLASLLLDMSDAGLAGVYNAACAQSCSKYDFIRALARICGYDEDLVKPACLKDAALKAPRPLDTTLDTAKLCAALRRPMPDLASGLEGLRDAVRSGG